MDLKVIFYNVGHGCCTHIITPNGKHVLVDVGSRAEKSIVRYVKNLYFPIGGKIDALIITHTHLDHICGILDMKKEDFFPRVLSRPKAAFEIIPDAENEFHKSVAQSANEMNLTYTNPVSDNDNPFFAKNNGGVEISVFHPPADLTNKDDPNTFSSVVVVEYGNFKFVLCGDNPPEILRKMLESNRDGFRDKVANSTILLAPHHGRKMEFCKEFFDLVKPELSVVSDKEIEHDTQEESSRIYAGHGCNLFGKMRYVLTTRNDGNIEFSVDGERGCVNFSNDY